MSSNQCPKPGSTQLTSAHVTLTTAKTKYPIYLLSAAMWTRRLTKTTKPRAPYRAVAILALVASVPLSLLNNRIVPERYRPLSRPLGGELGVVYASTWTPEPQVRLIDGTYKVVVGPSYRDAATSQQRELYQLAIDNDRSHVVLNVAHLAATIVLREATLKALVGDQEKLSVKRAATVAALDLGRIVASEGVRKAVARKLRERVNGPAPKRAL